MAVGLHLLVHDAYRAARRCDNVIINEIDADTPGNPTGRVRRVVRRRRSATRRSTVWSSCFYDGGLSPFTGKQSYAAFDLDGYSTDANGYFVLGNPGVPGCRAHFRSGSVRAVAERSGRCGALCRQRERTSRTARTPRRRICRTPSSTAPTIRDRANLLPLAQRRTTHVNENANGAGTLQSNQRCPNGTGGARNTFRLYSRPHPTPGAANECPAHRATKRRRHQPDLRRRRKLPTPRITTTTSSCTTAARIRRYQRLVAPVRVGGGQRLGLQHAAARRHDRSRRYYLIALASGGAAGAPLPPANITGQINMSGTSGKVALSDSFEPLTGNCPSRQRRTCGLRRLRKRRLPERGPRRRPV